MDAIVPLSSDTASSLAAALVASSQAPLVLLDENLTVQGASRSFCNAFQLEPKEVKGKKLCELGHGEWNLPQLDCLLLAAASASAEIDAYEIDLARDGHEPRRLVLNAHRLEYGDADHVRIVLTVTDVTAARLAERLRDDLVREKQVLQQELQHRVANSLQIIASVLMQSARKVQSEETRAHLRDAHQRVMSVATLQKQLAASRSGEVELRAYFTDLCRSIGASMIYDHDALALNATVDDSKADSEVSVSLGLIVTELVINALKHAFPGGAKNGKIAVDYSSQGSAWTMRVTDNGIGMPLKSASMKPGLGTGIVDALSKNLGASVIVTAANPGTRVSIVHA